MELINECSLRFAEDKDFRLLVCPSHSDSLFCAHMRKIIDSIMALFRVDFSGRGELSERQQKVRFVLLFAMSVYNSETLPACPGFIVFFKNSTAVIN